MVTLHRRHVRMINRSQKSVVEIIDPQGRAAEFTGYYGARDGKLTITLDLAANHPPGVWKVRATELASGLTQEGTFKVRAGTR